MSLEPGCIDLGQEVQTVKDFLDLSLSQRSDWRTSPAHAGLPGHGGARG